MAAVTKSTKGVSLASTLPPSNTRVSGRHADEDIVSGDACKLTATGIALAMGSDRVDGFALSDALEGEPLTLFHDVVARYGDALTPGTSYYLSTTVPGGLDTTENGAILAVSYDTQRVGLKRSW